MGLKIAKTRKDINFEFELATLSNYIRKDMDKIIPNLTKVINNYDFDVPPNNPSLKMTLELFNRVMDGLDIADLRYS